MTAPYTVTILGSVYGTTRPLSQGEIELIEREASPLLSPFSRLKVFEKLMQFGALADAQGDEDTIAVLDRLHAAAAIPVPRRRPNPFTKKRVVEEEPSGERWARMVPAVECPECWGTGAWKGWGGPCSRGCKIP